MSYDGSEGAIISLESAAQFTANWREANPEGFKAHYIGKDHLQDILDQTGCVGIRMYLAKDEKGENCMVAVGVSSNERDMTSGLIAERGYPCPPYCDDNSALAGA